jgi:porin
MMELNYGAQLTPTVRVMPNLQYIVNPDQSAEPYRPTNIPNAFVVGVKFTIDLGKLFGLGAPT